MAMTFFLLWPSTQLFCDELALTQVVKASLVFKVESKPNEYFPTRPMEQYPYLLVYLHLENLHDSNLSWVTDSVTDVEAELLDSNGHAVTFPSGGAFAASILSSTRAYSLPYGSKMDWLISHGGVSMVGNPGDLTEKVGLFRRIHSPLVFSKLQ